MDEKTKAYVAKRTVEGHSKLEIIRCLKRYLAREVYYLLNPGTPPTKGGGSGARRAGPKPGSTVQASVMTACRTAKWPLSWENAVSQHRIRQAREAT